MKRQKDDKPKAQAPYGGYEQQQGKTAPRPDPPAAGPHADPRLTNHDATPGSGAMSDPQKTGGEVDGATG
jgi:hypothetical protein